MGEVCECYQWRPATCQIQRDEEDGRLWHSTDETSLVHGTVTAVVIIYADNPTYVMSYGYSG